MHPEPHRAGQRDLASRLPVVLCVLAVHASLIAGMPALVPRVAAPPEPIAVRLLDPEPSPVTPPEPERPAVPLPAAANAPSRPASRPRRNPEAPIPRRSAPDPIPEPARGEADASAPTATSEPSAPVVPGATLAAPAPSVDGNGPVSAPPQREPATPAPGRSIDQPAATLVPARHDAGYLRNPAPAYPAMSRRLREAGEVLLRVDVAADGAVRAVEIERGSGHVRLDEAARGAVAGWRFIPARRGDAAVASRVLVPIVFRLDD